MIPTYDSNATAEEIQQKRVFLREQLGLIYDQMLIATPMGRVKIQCGCKKLVGWQYMFRCLYCGIWYCKECAEVHFGAKAPATWAGAGE